MSIGKHSETASRLVQVAESYLETFRSFGSGFGRNLVESHRQCLLEEIGRISQILIASLERKNLKEENAWAYLRHMGSHIYVFLATDEPPKGDQVRIPLQSFRSIRDELNKSIIEGKLDQQLSLSQGTLPTAAELILERFSRDRRA